MRWVPCHGQAAEGRGSECTASCRAGGCGKLSAQVNDHHTAIPVFLVVDVVGATRGRVVGQLDGGLLFASTLLFFAPSDLVNDKRR